MKMTAYMDRYIFGLVEVNKKRYIGGFNYGI